MDLVYPGGDCCRIVDYKTNALNGRSPAELASGYETQAMVYCLAALLAGAPAVQMDFVFLERPGEPVTMLFVHGDASRLQSELDGLLGGLRRAEFPPQAGDACTRCPVAEVCASMARP
jgi:hypothetical protein